MWPYHPELLATPVPRYTSYPTAAEFNPAVGESDLLTSLGEVKGDLSLYLHIPFCQQICWYCGCNTSRTNHPQRLSSYIDALHREIALVGARLAPGAKVTRIAFGGGSPNAISPIEFVRLLGALSLHLPLAQPLESSIELDPRTLTFQWAPALEMAGVRRASLGVQTFDPALQAAIGRVQPDADIARATDLARRAGVTSLNHDLMYGLPGQTLALLLASLARSVELGADRIALFGYAHVPHVVPRQRQIDASALPDQASRFAMAASGYDYLVGAGYVPVGFDHFAKPGDPLAQAARNGTLRRNFQGFTDDGAESLIGLGASAIGAFPDLLVQNEKNSGRYRMMVSQERLPAALGIRRTTEDRRRGTVIEALLCRGSAAIPGDLLAAARPTLERFRNRGLVEIADGAVHIAPAGLPYARSIAACFDAYRPVGELRFSAAI
jgi:oxygen-independent coproporphyrinogen III oxidase